MEYRDQYGQWSNNKRNISRAQGSTRITWSAVNSGGPGKAGWSKKSSCETGFLLRSCLFSSTLLAAARGHPHPHHPHQEPTLPLSCDRPARDPPCYVGSVGFKEPTHPKWHPGFSTWTEKQHPRYFSQRQNNLNLCEDVNFTRWSVTAVSKIWNVHGNWFLF